MLPASCTAGDVSALPFARPAAIRDTEAAHRGDAGGSGGAGGQTTEVWANGNQRASAPSRAAAGNIASASAVNIAAKAAAVPYGAGTATSESPQFSA